MTIPGYAGSILYVDLTARSVKREPLDAGTARTFLGGAGINNRLAYDLMRPDVDPLSPESAIIMGTGPFNGTMIPGSSELMVLYKSPLNGYFLYSCGGGRFSHFLKSCGYDHLVITGRSDKPAYLKIGEDTELCDASDLWGIDSVQTTDELRRRYEPCSVLPIGQAGENQVAISVAFIDKGGTVGSGGLAAVMGSKNLKAIVVTLGSKGVEVADRRRLQKTVDDILTQVKGYRLRDEMMQGGMMAMTANWMPEGSLIRCSTVLKPYPANIKDIQQEIYEFHKRSRTKIACATCPMCDKDRIDLPGYGTVYDVAISAERAITGASAGVGHSDTASPQGKYTEALRFYDMMNRYGIDRLYSFPGVVDFVVTLYEDGVITREDIDGIELDRNLETVTRLAKLTALRQGFGDILAGGVVSAAKKIGRNAEKYVQNVVKGQFTTFDPRLMGLGAYQFAQLTHPGRTLGTGGAMGAPSYSPGWPIERIREQAARCGLPEEAAGRIFTANSFNVGRITKHGEDFFCLFNIFGLCHRLYISRFYNMNTLAELYSAVTGVDTSPSDLKLASERAWNLWKALNCRAGFDRKDDEPPAVWFEPLKGPDRDYHLVDYFKAAPLTREDVDRFLDDYYDERGWDRERGIPTPEKLRVLGLGNIRLSA